jgi:CubicO group peptidase (beta-lactamase class C family)
MRPFRLALLAAAVPLAAPAQAPSDLPPVAARMQKFVAAGDIAGAVTVVGFHGGGAQTLAVGLRDLDGKVPMTQDTLFRIASMTKPITATAVMILSDEGKLAVTDPVEKYLPEFKGQKLAGGGLPARPVTLKDLLTHTSGLASNYPGAMKDVYGTRDFTLAETVAAVAKEPLQAEPGTVWKYCNPGIDTLGRVVEVVSGQSYEAFLKARIFDPLGMTETTPYATAEQISRTARVYNKDKDGKLVAETSPRLAARPGAKHPIPAGGLVSSAADLSRFYRMALNKGELDGKRILKAATVAEMTRDQLPGMKCGFVDGSGMGLGWLVVREPVGVTEKLSPGTFGHGGAFGTQAWLDPTRGMYMVMLIQRTGLQNGDASPMRVGFQEAAVAAVRP